VNRIVSFIDDSSRNGAGILVHSVKGQNRGCIVIIIYCMKKFRWNLIKSIEFLSSKKFDVDIPKYFLNQLSIFESWLTKMGIGPTSSKWESNEKYGSEAEQDEIILNNTYINGLPPKPQDVTLKRPTTTSFSSNNKKLKWTDNGSDNRRDLLCSCNLAKDLLNLKEIKPVEHKKGKTKSILKGSGGSIKSISNSTTTLNEVKRPLNSSRQNLNDLIPERKSSFTSQTNNFPITHQQRPNSVDNRDKDIENIAKGEYNSNYNVVVNEQNLSSNFNNVSNSNNINKLNERGSDLYSQNQPSKIVISPNIQSIINNNINNFYIQSPSTIGEYEYKKDSSRDQVNNFVATQYPNNKFINNFINPNSNNDPPSNHPQSVNFNNSVSNKTMNYNYVGHNHQDTNSNPFKAINGLSYTPNHNKSSSSGSVNPVKNMYLNPVSTVKKPSTSVNPNPSSAPTNLNNLNILPKTNVKVGPVKVPHIEKKSDQLINNLSTIKYKNGPQMSSSITQNFGLGNNQLGIIKRSTSKQRNEDRPSTAPSKYEKEKENSSRKLYGDGSEKRLPSPNIKSSSMGNNKPPAISNYGKRQPSPQVRSIGLSSSFKPSSNKYNLR